LTEGLVSFYLPDGVDREHGGYFESLEGDRFDAGGLKHLIFQTRQLWFFSTLVSRGIEAEQARWAAESGFRFLMEHLRDRDHGGFHMSVTRDGTPEDRRKHLYGQAFALYGLVAFHRATGSTEALRAARDLFSLLHRSSHDPVHGGFVEWFEPDWSPARESGPPRIIGRAGHKTFNTHLHVLEAFAELYRVWPHERLRARLEELIHILTSTIQVPPFPSNVDAFHADWTVVNERKNLRVSYGHDLEVVWLVLDTLPDLGIPLGRYTEWAESLCQSCISLGFDHARGGVFQRGYLGEPANDRKKRWWVQAESMIAFLRMYAFTGRDEYYDAFAATFRFVQQQQVAPGGGWWQVLEEDGSRRAGTQRTGAWQAAYHSGRALMLCAETLESLR
jgi:mannobiose 2-epimerase